MAAIGIVDSSFEDRLQSYNEWAQDRHTKGRLLGEHMAQSPLATTTDNPTIVKQPEHVPSGTTPSATKQSAPAPAPGGYGYCKVLRYAPYPTAGNPGYANTTLVYDRIVKDSPNFGECCKSCNADPKCKAWTRVAGGEPLNFRNCYLKYNLGPRNQTDQVPVGFDPSPNKFDNNHVGHPAVPGVFAGDDKVYPELRYVNLGWQDPNYPVILESGTVDDVYPADYYGCPYEPFATTPCTAPPTCNFGPDNKLVLPKCIGD